MDSKDIMTVTGEIVSAYFSHNSLTAEQVPTFIRSVQSALGGANENIFPEGSEGVEESPTAAVGTVSQPFKISEGGDIVKETVFPDHIICLEDGQKLKMLKRHLETYHNLSPVQYRKKHGLPKDYPMVAPQYSSTRSKLAKQFGLGRTPAPAPAPQPEQKKTEKKQSAAKAKAA